MSTIERINEKVRKLKIVYLPTPNLINYYQLKLDKLKIINLITSEIF